MTYHTQDAFETWLDEAFAALCGMGFEDEWQDGGAAPWDAFTTGLDPEGYAVELVACGALNEWSN